MSKLTNKISRQKFGHDIKKYVGGGPERVGWVLTLDTIIQSYGSSILSISLGLKTLNTSLGLGAPKLKTRLQAPPGRDLIPPLGAFRCDTPALPPPPPRVRSPNNGTVGNQDLCLHSRCFMSFGNLFDVSSVFWLFFQTNLLNHPHRPSLSTSECTESWS